MKREEIKSTKIYAHFASEVYDDFGEVSSEQEYYRKEHADSVMDAMEARIKELESQLENVQSSMYAENVDANMALVKANKRIKELEAEVIGYKASLERANFKALEKDARISENNARIKELEAENARLKAQVPKWHDLTKPLYTEDGVNYYDLPAEYGFYIVDCGGKECVQSEFDPDYNDWCDLVSTTKVLRWCEFPTTEESSSTEKENG